MSNKFFEVSDIINSIRFYMMLSIVCKLKDDFVGDSENQLMSFLSYLQKETNYSKERIDSYIKVAADSIPSSFAKYYGFETTIKR